MIRHVATDSGGLGGVGGACWSWPLDPLFLKVLFPYIYFREANFQTNWPSTLGKKTKHIKIRQTKMYTQTQKGFYVLDCTTE